MTTRFAAFFATAGALAGCGGSESAGAAPSSASSAAGGAAGAGGGAGADPTGGGGAASGGGAVAGAGGSAGASGGAGGAGASGGAGAGGGAAQGGAGGSGGTANQGGGSLGSAGGGGEPQPVFVPVEPNVPTGFLCTIPDAETYVDNGGDPVHVPCDLEADSLSDRDPDDVPPTLSFVTWNVRFGIESATIASELATRPELEGADFLVLQEVARHDQESVPAGINQARELATALSMNYVFGVEWDRRLNADQGGEHGVAILSKYPLGNVVQLRHVMSDDFYAEDKTFGGRTTLGADADVGGTLVRIYSSHFDTRPQLPDDSWRAKQGAEVRADADLPQRPTRQLVGGDLNTWTCNPTLADCTVAPAAEAVVEDFLAAGWADGTSGWNGITQLGIGFFPQRLDWIFHRGLAASPGVGIDADGSDHFPLYCSFAVP